MIYNILFLYYGLFSILGQLLLLRELSVVFYANELFLGAALAGWFFWVGFGSFAERWLKFLHVRPGKKFAFLMFVLANVLLLDILAIRLTATFFPFGTFIGPLPTVAVTFLSLAPICVILGLLFPMGCRILEENAAGKVAGAGTSDGRLGRVYFWESAGAILGGFLFSYVLIGRVPVFTAAFLLFLASACLGLYFLLRQGAYFITLQVVSLALMLSAVTVFIAKGAVERYRWEEYDIIAQAESKYASLTLAKLGSLYNIFENGILTGHFPDPAAYEEISHWPMLVHPDPGEVLAAGPAAWGMLSEILKHSPASVDYAEMDGKVISMTEPYLAAADKEALLDARVHTHNMDARLFIRMSGKKYDVMILSLPEPSCIQVNRFYTKEFYEDVRSALAPDGIISFSAPSAENYIGPQTRVFNASIYSTLKSVFDYVEILPGDNIIFLASQSDFSLDKKLLRWRYADRRISNNYVVPGYFKYKLQPARMEYAKRSIKGVSKPAVNTDFNPIGYSYYGRLWMRKFSSPVYFAAAAALLAALYLLRKVIFLRARRVDGKRILPHAFVFSVGFIGILTELILIMAYQATVGYVYWHMGFLFGCFMLGLVSGAALGRGRAGLSKKAYLRGMMLAILAMAAVAYLIPGIITRAYPLGPGILYIIYPALLIIIGFLVGAGFILGGYLLLLSGKQTEGTVYSFDVWGASLGALITGLLLIPLFGLWGSLYAGSALGGAILVMIIAEYAKT
ncbi:MAG: hypothetical protein ABH825_02465 [Candidatus Omnitrophota bacterium]